MIYKAHVTSHPFFTKSVKEKYFRGSFGGWVDANDAVGQEGPYDVKIRSVAQFVME